MAGLVEDAEEEPTPRTRRTEVKAPAKRLKMKKRLDKIRIDQAILIVVRL